MVVGHIYLTFVPSPSLILLVPRDNFVVVVFPGYRHLHGSSLSNKSCRRTASSPAGYILYCNIFIIKPYNIGHTDLDVCM